SGVHVRREHDVDARHEHAGAHGALLTLAAYTSGGRHGGVDAPLRQAKQREPWFGRAAVEMRLTIGLVSVAESPLHPVNLGHFVEGGANRICPRSMIERRGPDRLIRRLG